MSGETVQFAQRQLSAVDWSPRWPPFSDWCKAAAIGALIGIGLGLNSQVWPWTMLALVPRVTFWLVLSLVIALQWVVAASLLPFIGHPGWVQRVARTVTVLFVLTPVIGIEGAVVTRIAGLQPTIALTDMSVAFAWQFLRWGSVLALPVVLAISLRDRTGSALRTLQETPFPVQGAPTPDAVSNDGGDRHPLWSAIIALKAEDHYVRVYTEHSDTLVLMRFADAVARVAESDGIQVHRSYWVRNSVVKTLVRNGRRYELHLRNGQVAPVSRAFETRVKSRFRNIAE